MRSAYASGRATKETRAAPDDASAGSRGPRTRPGLILDLVRITKAYGRAVPAVSDVSLRVEDGELLVLVGPSGCGKSTLLRMIAGLEPVTAGEIRIGDRVVNDVAPRDRDIAMVFQSYALYPHMNVFDNLAFGLRRRKTPGADVERRVREVAELLGLVPHLARKPRELSGGERQRVALGRALARRPQVFLFDEPLSNLDAQLRGQMRVEIKRLHQQVRATMIYVTHDQVEAMTLGDRIAVLRTGVLQQVADPFRLYRGRLHRQPADQPVHGDGSRRRAAGFGGGRCCVPGSSGGCVAACRPARQDGAGRHPRRGPDARPRRAGRCARGQSGAERAAGR